MRLITRKIWRAFPELDRFDDGQCERFVRAANGREDLKLARNAVCVFVLLAFGLSPMWATWVESLGEWVELWDGDVVGDWFSHIWWYKPLWFFAAVHVSLWVAGALCAGWTRDILLRRRVREVMVSHGSCAACTYFLGGLPVGPGYRVTCPECGAVVVVDQALIELAPGGAKFAPTLENLQG